MDTVQESTAAQVNTNIDPGDEAFNPTPRYSGPRTYYGRVAARAWPCALITGQGKVPFDPAIHPANKRSICVDLCLDTLDEMGLQFALNRQCVTWDREWTKVTLPSLKALNLGSVTALNGQWVAMQFRPTGRTYQSKGETKEATGMHFVGLYGSEDECREAYATELASREDGDGSDTMQATQPRLNVQAPAPTPVSAPAPAPDPARNAAAQFLKVLCNMHKGNPAQLAAAIKSMPQVAAYFDENSEETKQFVAEALGISNN